jgi:Protein of unknown function (DUF3754)
MSDGHVSQQRLDGYVPVRKAELIAALASGGDGDVTLVEVCKLMGALLSHLAHERLEALKALYDPLDPDAPPSRRDESAGAFSAFEQGFVEALTRANFAEVEGDAVQTRAATKVLTDLSIKPSLAGIRRIRFFARGGRMETLTVKRWGGLRTLHVDAEVLSDVAVLVSFKAEGEISRSERGMLTRMRQDVRPGAALVKYFRNVAAPELVTLHPGAKPSMRPRDQVFLAAPALAGGVPVLINLWPALTVLGAVAAAYFTAGQVIDSEKLTRAVGALGGLIAVGAFAMRQRLKYEATTLRYHKRLADTVYFRNLANNAGALDTVVGAGEEQDIKEAMLAYWALHRAAAPLTNEQVDSACEAFLRSRFNLDVDFEVGDALEKLERLELITRQGDEYAAVSPADALTKLDAIWDGLFHYPTAEGVTG